MAIEACSGIRAAAGVTIAASDVRPSANLIKLNGSRESCSILRHGAERMEFSLSLFWVGFARFSFRFGFCFRLGVAFVVPLSWKKGGRCETFPGQADEADVFIDIENMQFMAIYYTAKSAVRL